MLMSGKGEYEALHIFPVSTSCSKCTSKVPGRLCKGTFSVSIHVFEGFEISHWIYTCEVYHDRHLRRHRAHMQPWSLSSCSPVPEQTTTSAIHLERKCSSLEVLSFVMNRVSAFQSCIPCKPFQETGLEGTMVPEVSCSPGI